VDTRANVRGRQVHSRLRLALAAAGLFAAAACSISQAAPAPVIWCGTTPSATDRPDIVGGDQIHVIYATPSDSPDRFASLASAITTDLNAVNSWWKRQDPTRAPRFDYAAIGCTGFGSLDITDVKLPHDTAFYSQVSTPRLSLLRDDLIAAGFTDPAKKYLVYYDQAQASTSMECGNAYVSAQSGGTKGYAAVFIAPNLEGSGAARGCGSIEASAPRGGFLAVVAAHELINELGALDPATPGPPHRCPGDAFHPCDSNLDVLYPTPAATTIDAAVLDFGHDDYYAHSGTWWDVQDSPWLRHLDVREAKLHVSVGAGGASVAVLDQPSMSCAPGASCAWTWATGSPVNLSATAAPGYRFVRWTGCPTVAGPICTVSVDTALKVGAVFARPLTAKSFHLSFVRTPLQLTASIRLNRRVGGVADSIGCSFAGQKVAATVLHGDIASCTWMLPSRFRGHRLQGVVELDQKGETVLTKRFHVVVPRS
jgi:hypothetical protein